MRALSSILTGIFWGTILGACWTTVVIAGYRKQRKLYLGSLGLGIVIFLFVAFPNLLDGRKIPNTFFPLFATVPFLFLFALVIRSRLVFCLAQLGFFFMVLLFWPVIIHDLQNLHMGLEEGFFLIFFFTLPLLGSAYAFVLEIRSPLVEIPEVRVPWWRKVLVGMAVPTLSVWYLLAHFSLPWACIHGSLPALKFWLFLKPDSVSEPVPLVLNREGKVRRVGPVYEVTPLHVTAYLDHVSAAELLLARGASANIQDKGGQTPLDWASVSGSMEVASLLMEHGADLGGRELTGLTPLHRAAAFGHEKIAKFLITQGANVNAENFCGMTPLHYAAWYGYPGIVQLLLDHGADANAKTNQKRFPGYFYRRPGEIIKFGTIPPPLLVDPVIYKVANIAFLERYIGPQKDFLDSPATPLSFALTNGQEESANLLIKNGGIE